MDGKALAEYVDLKMKAKGLTRVDIEKRSEKMITDGHVAYVLAGKAKNPTLKILLGLAKGLDVDPYEVFRVAANLDSNEPGQLDTYTLIQLINQIANNPDLAEAVVALSRQKPEKIKSVLKTLKK
ncbi:MAG: hypothetical protein WBV94_24210 [Blastocatellia bacterium]